MQQDLKLPLLAATAGRLWVFLFLMKDYWQNLIVLTHGEELYISLYKPAVSIGSAVFTFHGN